MISLNKYFIAIVPPEPIRGEIYSMKEYVRDKYKSRGALNSPTHITLHMPFEWAEEERLVTTLKRFSFAPFQIELKDFDRFEPRVIFVDVKKNSALEQMQQNLARFCKTELNLFNAGYHDRPYHPHVTIAFRDLKKPAFVEAWKEFKDRKYHAFFECDHISVMKHDGKIWREFS